MKTFAALAIVGFLSLASFDTGDVLASPNVEVGRAEFGLFDSSGAEFTQSTKVPLKEGQAYGWRIYVTTDRGQVRVREEFHLPVAPQTWGQSQPGQSVSSDGKTSTVEVDVPITAGFIQHGWTVAPGDPPGEYVIRVFIEGGLVATFRFDVD